MSYDTLSLLISIAFIRLYSYRLGTDLKHTPVRDMLMPLFSLIRLILLFVMPFVYSVNQERKFLPRYDCS